MKPRLVFIALVAFNVGQIPVMAQSVKLEGRTFKIDGQEFYPRVMNVAVDVACNTNDATTGLYWSMGHNYGVPPNGGIDCTDPTSCRADIVAAFQKVVAMGFNTVRLVAMGPELRGTNGGEFYINVRHNSSAPPDGDAWPPYTLMLEESANFHGPIADDHFQRLRDLLAIANDAGLKVILLCQGSPAGSGWSAAWDWNAAERVAGYLSRLADELVDDPALFAYDLHNEPHWTNQGFRDRNKNEVCAMTSLWYDAIKANDPNHLVTLGNSAFEDLYAWEPNVMKLDFVSFHVYPDMYPQDGYSFDGILNRVKAKVYWYSQGSPMPFIIGETGFSAEASFDDHWVDPGQQQINHLDAVAAHHAPPWMNGSEVQQATYAEETMDATREYFGSGFSWWEFQNSDAGSLSDPAGDYLAKFYSLLKYGDVNQSWYDKLAVNTMSTYVLPPPPVTENVWYPDNYDRGRFDGSHGSGAFVRDINLRDQNDSPIRNAVVWQKISYVTPAGVDAFAIDNWFPTYDEGVIVRAGPTYPATQEYPAMHELEIYVPGGKMHKYNSIWEPASDLQMHREELLFKDYVWNVVVPVGEVAVYGAWSWLVLLNTVYEGNGETGGTGEIRSRDLIELRDGFHAEFGSAVHIHNDAVWPDCSSTNLSTLQLEENEQKPVDAKARVAKTLMLEIAFNVTDDLMVTVMPNPCSEYVLLQTRETSGEYTLRNEVGALKKSGRLTGSLTRLDMLGLADGLYCITVYSRDIERAFWITKTH